MIITEVTTMLSTLGGVITALGSWGAWKYSRQNKKLKDLEVALSEANVRNAKMQGKSEEWRIWKEQCEALSEQNKHLIARNDQLVKMNADKEDRHQQDIKDWEERFTDQTKVLRDTQREFRDTLSKQIAQEQEIGDLKEENAYLRQWLCEDSNCDHGIPPRERLKGKIFDKRRFARKQCTGECKNKKEETI